MTHTDPAHLSPAHHLMTGRIAPKPNSDADGASRGDAPCFGAVVQKLLPSPGAGPPAVTLPWAVSHPSAPGGTAPGQNGGWLGNGFDPFLVTGDPNLPSFAVAGLRAPADVPADRLRGRAELARLLDRTGGPGGAYTAVQSKALDLLLAPAVSTAFDLSRESATIRDKYGRHAHGQSCLLARRLIEVGTRLVTVNWPDDGRAFWDTHGNNFPALQTRLMPPADAAFAALLDDLTARLARRNVGGVGRRVRAHPARGGRRAPALAALLLGGTGRRRRSGRRDLRIERQDRCPPGDQPGVARRSHRGLDDLRRTLRADLCDLLLSGEWEARRWV